MDEYRPGHSNKKVKNELNEETGGTERVRGEAGKVERGGAAARPAPERATAGVHASRPQEETNK